MKKLMCTCLFSAVLLASCGEEIATVTKDEFERLESGMTYEEVVEIVGGIEKEKQVNHLDETLVMYEFDGEDGAEDDSNVSLLFNKEKLDIKLETGLLSEVEELTQDEKNKINEENRKMLLEKDVIEIINNTLGETNNLDKSTVESVEVSEDKIAISLNGSDNVTNNAVKEMMWMDSAKILELIEEESGSKDISVNWQFPLVDTYGNETDEVVMSFDLDRETLNKINWENFSSDNIPNISKNYYEHAAFNK